jgi:hypothetical protein
MRRLLIALRLFAATALMSGLLVAAIGVHPASATSITVNTASDPAPNAQGHFPTDGKCSLRATIDSAVNNSNADDVDCATGYGESASRACTHVMMPPR